MDPVPVPAVPAAPSDPVPTPILVPEASPAPVVAETVAEPAIPAADDLTKVMDAAGGGGMGLVALVILVVGGAAGWKFWSKLSEQKHEQKMKQLEIDAQAQGLGSAQPIPCQSVTKVQADAIAKLNAQVEDLASRLTRAERKSSSFADFDADDFTDRIEKLEKAVKATKTPSKPSAAKTRAVT